MEILGHMGRDIEDPGGRHEVRIIKLLIGPDGAAPAGMLDSMHAAGGRSMRE